MSTAHLIAFLAEHGADRAPHAGGRTLLEHLVGTHALLARWRAAEAVCLAGLFHSVYGTAAYRRQSVPLAERARVATLIGEGPERLAFLFGIADRPRAWHKGSLGPFPRIPILGGGAVTVERRDLGALLEIECANLLEQPGGLAYLHTIADPVTSGRVPVTRACRRAVEAALRY